MSQGVCQNWYSKSDDWIAPGNSEEKEMYALTYLQSLALRLRKDKSGAVATEYAFLIAFIAIVAALGMVLLGQNLSDFFNDIGVALENAGDAIPDLPS